MTPLAHSGNWLADMLYVAPVLVIAGWIGIRALIDRRREEHEGVTPARGPAGPGPDRRA